MRISQIALVVLCLSGAAQGKPVSPSVEGAARVSAGIASLFGATAAGCIKVEPSAETYRAMLDLSQCLDDLVPEGMIWTGTDLTFSLGEDDTGLWTVSLDQAIKGDLTRSGLAVLAVQASDVQLDLTFDANALALQTADFQAAQLAIDTSRKVENGAIENHFGSAAISLSFAATPLTEGRANLVLSSRLTELEILRGRFRETGRPGAAPLTALRAAQHVSDLTLRQYDPEVLANLLRWWAGQESLTVAAADHENLKPLLGALTDVIAGLSAQSRTDALSFGTETNQFGIAQATATVEGSGPANAASLMRTLHLEGVTYPDRLLIDWVFPDLPASLDLRASVPRLDLAYAIPALAELAKPGMSDEQRLVPLMGIALRLFGGADPAISLDQIALIARDWRIEASGGLGGMLLRPAAKLDIDMTGMEAWLAAVDDAGRSDPALARLVRAAAAMSVAGSDGRAHWAVEFAGGGVTVNGNPVPR